MKPALFGLTLGLLAYTAWLIAYSPSVARAVVDPRYSPKYRTLTKA
jgi:hypothetical protein